LKIYFDIVHKSCHVNLFSLSHPSHQIFLEMLITKRHLLTLWCRVLL